MLMAEFGFGKGNQSDYPFANRFCGERASVVDLLRGETLLAGISERFLQCGGRCKRRTKRGKTDGRAGSMPLKTNG